MKFSSAIRGQEARTENNMKALKSSSDANVDLFYRLGAMRGQNVIAAFTAAFVADREKALRIAQWARDVRHGAGERQIFRDILVYLEANNVDSARILMRKTPELGRWDDLLVLQRALKNDAYSMIEQALNSGNGLCAKWMPRQGTLATDLRQFMRMTPKKYRKMLVNNTKVVETSMCAKDWEWINFSHVPSVASARYKKAFFKRSTDAYKSYLASLKSGDPRVKVNAGAVYPYDVIKTARRGDRQATELVIAQWNALPNYVMDAKTLPMVDVSGSMEELVSGSSVSAMDVAVSLGLYLADKNTGDFKDCFLTFSTYPELLQLRGNIIQKMDQMISSQWAMSTDLHKAFDLILNTAIKGKVSQDEMPQVLLILSDMQFNRCVRFDDSAKQMIDRKYEAAGYTAPKVVFWNLRDAGNAPVSFDTSGTALVSGFSPAIMKSIINGKDFTPEAIMMTTIMNPRYDLE